MLRLLTSLEVFVERAVGEVDANDKKKSLYYFLPRIEENVHSSPYGGEIFDSYIYLQALAKKDLVEPEFHASIWKKNRALVVIQNSKVFADIVHVLLSVCCPLIRPPSCLQA